MQDDAFSFNSSQLSDNPMMTESEAQKIIQGYNGSIQQLVKENDQLQRKLEELMSQEKDEENKMHQARELYNQQTKRMEDLKAKQFLVDKERDEFFNLPLLVEQKKHNPQLIACLVEFLHYDQKKPSISSFSQLDQQNSLMQFDEDDEVNKVDDPILNEVTHELNHQTQIKTQHVTQILEAIYKYAELQMQKCSKKECQQCHQLYNPRTNHIDSCLFHSGKLKFYSCKKCGADDYYTCCSKCIRCCEGCKTNFHQPIP